MGICTHANVLNYMHMYNMNTMHTVYQEILAIVKFGDLHKIRL